MHIVIDKILNCEYKYLSNSFKLFQNADRVYKSLTPVTDKYCVNVKSKTRYIVPLVQVENRAIRINEISDVSANQIAEYLKLPKGGYYTGFDFPFEPYEETIV